MAFRRKKIATEKTIGGKLRAARLKKKLPLEKAEEETKIRLKYLEAIEADNWRGLPSRVYTLGFVRRYSEYLGLDPEAALDEFKQTYGRPYRPSFSLKVNRNRFFNNFVLTPRVLISTAVVLLVLGALLYIGFSVVSFSKPPVIDIIAPQDTTVTQSDLQIEGKTLSSAIVEINNQPVNVGDDGSFVQKVQLTPGVNVFDVTAKNRVGKQSEKVIKILFEAK
jgi:cytoskeletal protein RodZ